MRAFHQQMGSSTAITDTVLIGAAMKTQGARC